VAGAKKTSLPPDDQQAHNRVGPGRITAKENNTMAIYSARLGSEPTLGTTTNGTTAINFPAYTTYDATRADGTVVINPATGQPLQIERKIRVAAYGELAEEVFSLDLRAGRAVRLELTRQRLVYHTFSETIDHQPIPSAERTETVFWTATLVGMEVLPTDEEIFDAEAIRQVDPAYELPRRRIGSMAAPKGAAIEAPEGVEMASAQRPDWTLSATDI
jgi:hypothetical protein